MIFDMVRKSAGITSTNELTTIELPIVWISDNWASALISGSMIGKIVKESLIQHPLRSLSLPGIVILDGRRGCVVKGKGTGLKLFQGLPVISGECAGGSKKHQTLILLGDVDAPSITTKGPFGTNTQRIEIGTKWQSIEIISDPFIQPTALGYAPTVLIKDHQDYVWHLLIGAKSLALPLEVIRKDEGSLIGSRVKIRKSSELSSSAYEFQKI